MARNQGNEALLHPYEFPSATDKPVIHNINNPNAGYILINKNTKYPKAVFKLVNFFAYMIDDAQNMKRQIFQ